MGHGARYRTGLRRHRRGRTDHRRRLKLLKSGKPRAVVRRSLRNTRVQIVAFDPDGDRVTAQAEALELADRGWTGSGANCPAAYLTGYLAGARAVEAGVAEAVLDIGDHAPSPGSNVFAALRGLLDAGVDVPHGEAVLPSARRLRGEHIDDGTPDAFDSVLEALGGDPVGVRAEADDEPPIGTGGDGGDASGEADADEAGTDGADTDEAADDETTGDAETAEADQAPKADEADEADRPDEEE